MLFSEVGSARHPDVEHRHGDGGVPHQIPQAKRIPAGKDIPVAERVPKLVGIPSTDHFGPSRYSFKDAIDVS